MKKFKLILCYGLALALLGCASAEKAELVSTDNLEAAVSEVTVLLKEANCLDRIWKAFQPHFFLNRPTTDTESVFTEP